MISCKRETELVSKRLDGGISKAEELELRMHLFLCEFCQKFVQQADLLKSALGAYRALNESPSEGEVCSCSPPTGAKDRLREKLKSKLAGKIGSPREG